MKTFTLAFTLLTLSLPAASLAQDEAELATKAKAVFEKHCYACHGKEGSNEGGFNYILNHERLLASKKVIAGDAKNSRLLKRMASEEMPPDEDSNGKAIKDRPSVQEVAAVKAWIDAGAPDFNPKVAARLFISNTDILELIHKDLLAANERSRKFLRYFTITHLYNAGLSDDELLSYRVGLSKLLNSLSWGRDVKAPEAIGSAKTIFRIDLRQYGWKEATWERILAANPYGVTYTTTAAKGCYDLCQTTLPYVRADWFVFAASRPPLYHDVLELPKTDLELEKLLRVDVEENLRVEEVARAAFNGSGVSRNNRLIERHKSPYGAYWKSYDFASNVGRQNLFEHPLGPGKADNLFKHDGGEIIFNLPNGLQAYFLTDGEGKRIDKGPINVVSDPKQSDRSVVNGVSCMSCHNQGMIVKADQVRAHVEKNPEGFTKAEADSIKALYPVKADFEKVLKEDAERFRKAVEASGAHLSKTEPVYALSGQFENEIDIKMAAAEVGVTENDFGKGLGRSPKLARVFGPLRVVGGTVQRQVLVEHFEELAAVLLPDGTFRRGGSVVANEPKPGEEREFDVGNGVKMRFCWIPGSNGKFKIGSPKAEQDYLVKTNLDGKRWEGLDFENEHEVAGVDGFWMAKTEMTQAQYVKLTGKQNPSNFSAEGDGKFAVAGLNTNDFPVEGVSWEGAQACIKGMKAPAGMKRIGLPSEVQWEWAARGGRGNGRAFYWGDELNGDKANSNGEFPYGTPTKGSYLERTTKVGSYETKAAHPWGLCDMHGNVYEWCEDYYGAYAKLPGGKNPAQTVEQLGDLRVLRGGSWFNYSSYCRSAAATTARRRTASATSVSVSCCLRRADVSMRARLWCLASRPGKARQAGRPAPLGSPACLVWCQASRPGKARQAGRPAPPEALPRKRSSDDVDCPIGTFPAQPTLSLHAWPSASRPRACLISPTTVENWSNATSQLIFRKRNGTIAARK